MNSIQGEKCGCYLALIIINILKYYIIKQDM